MPEPEPEPEPDVPPEVWDKVAAELARQKTEGHDRRERRGLWIVAVASLVLAVVAVAFSTVVLVSPQTVGLAAESEVEEVGQTSKDRTDQRIESLNLRISDLEGATDARLDLLDTTMFWQCQIVQTIQYNPPVSINSDDYEEVCQDFFDQAEGIE